MTNAFSPQFWSLGLCDELLRAADDLGYESPTPVQVEAIPAILRGGDLWASAKTGSGKTAAFGLPILQALHAGGRSMQHPVAPYALVLAPTRELASQIGEAIAGLAAHIPRPVKTVVVVGGLSVNPQMMALRGGADIIVATPGRLLDLHDNNALHLSELKMLVLDEADRLLSLGFSEEISRVVALIPRGCQKLLFSATFPAAVRALAQALLNEPTKINIDEGAMPEASFIAQRVIEIDSNKRTSLLKHLVKAHEWKSMLVFAAAKQATENIAEKLQRNGLLATPLHGDLSQAARTTALHDFREGRLKILVATDLAARGIDIDDLAAVVNYDLPRSPADYLHRIGRTGRAGQSGVAVTFINAANAAHFALIEQRHNMTLEREQIVGFEPTGVDLPPAHPHGGIKGKRKSKKDKLREAAARSGPSED